MIAGAHDPRCPASETLQAKEELKRRGKEADVAIYDDEGHSFRKLDYRLDVYKKTTEFLTNICINNADFFRLRRSKM